MSEFLNSDVLHKIILDERNMEEIKKLLLESSSTSDSEEDVEVIPKKRRIQNYISNVVPLYTSEDFKSHFRMSRTQFERLLQILGNSWKSSEKGRPKCSLEKTLLATIWYLANVESFRQTGDRFDLHRGQAQKTIMELCKMLYGKRREFIKWPEGDLLRKTVDEFNVLRGNNSFPNVVSCIDGTHIIISGSQTDNSYYNRHGQHSIQLQATCNARMVFTDIYVGWPGSVHDARVWRNSSLYNKLTRETPLPPEMHLLGDSAYPISNFLLTPYRDDGHLSVANKIFNKKLSSTRVIIEQAFGRLKGIFRRLRFLEVRNLENAKYIVMAACILHNFLLESPDDESSANFEDFHTEENESNSTDETPEDNDTIAGNTKREYLTQLFSYGQ